jgi:hypothetical protein
MGASSELERADETISLKHVHKYMPWEPPASSKEPTKHYPYSMYASTCHGTAPSESPKGLTSPSQHSPITLADTHAVTVVKIALQL